MLSNIMWIFAPYSITNAFEQGTGGYSGHPLIVDEKVCRVVTKLISVSHMLSTINSSVVEVLVVMF